MFISGKSFSSGPFATVMSIIIVLLVDRDVVGEGQPVPVLEVGGSIRFVLQDYIDSPYYWWPRTLVGYPVRFAAGIDLQYLTLRRADTGKAVPMQLSEVSQQNGHIAAARINFFTDLPSKGRHEYVLQTAEVAIPVTEPAVRETVEGSSLVVDTGAVKLRLPLSQTPTDVVPGPIQQMSRGDKWLGKSTLISPRRRVINIKIDREERGSLFTLYRVTYTFDGGGMYVARIKCIAGQDFVPLRESMQGITPEDDICVDQQWTDFNPTHRQAPNHPYQGETKEVGYAHFKWERIDQTLVSTQHGVSAGLGVDGELPFRLGPYQAWGAYVTLNYANFWNEKTSDAVGVFIDHIADWQDNQYALWMSSSVLQVRYFYQDGLLRWRWPLATGTRSTNIVCYDHQKDVKAVTDLMSLPKPLGIGGFRSPVAPTSYVAFLSIRHGILDLDVVKGWVLKYPSNAKRPVGIFDATSANQNSQDFIDTFFRSELVSQLPLLGVRQNAGYNPVGSRRMADDVATYCQLCSQMTFEQRQRIEAIFLLIAYVNSGEDVMPLRTMLAGHPNFLADIKSIPAMMVMLFPDHPMANEWADQFERFVDLNARYHTRPPVTSWDASGGRWTENLGTYVFAFLRPTIRSAWALRDHFDGRNRLANQQVSWLGDWLVNSLTAPIGDTDPNASKKIRTSLGAADDDPGPWRVYPPQGAHALRRLAPLTLGLLGVFLQRFDPITAEHLMWATPVNGPDFERAAGPWDIMYHVPHNRGTNPHLKSSKYTGYGIVLRSAVDTPNEVSVHLQQIDSGPNYRWGISGPNGSGVIYYYASGKCYSHNGHEDVGDRECDDTDFCCNFGVFKDGRFKSIGENVLDRPFYDLGTAQLAELVPAQGSDSYSWPQYQSRRVMLVDADYIVVNDAVYSDAIATRFSWFTEHDEQLPSFTILKGGSVARRTDLTTAETKGVWFDGAGDSQVLVTHLPNIIAQRNRGEDFALVKGDQWTDMVFFNASPTSFVSHDKSISFDGAAGVIRRGGDGSTVLTIFHGASISGGGVTLSTSDPDLGVSSRFIGANEIAGTCSSTCGGSLKIHFKPQPGTAIYIDGVKSNVITTGIDGSWIVQLPAGSHHWQVTVRQPIPMIPVVVRTENHPGGARVVFSPAGGAVIYRIELSSDNGVAWKTVGKTSETTFDIANQADGKVHVRVTGSNDDCAGKPSDEYPIYISSAVPPPPDGLRLTLSPPYVPLNWGEILGTKEYRLYRCPRGSGAWQCIYHGLAKHFVDTPSGIVAPALIPGVIANISGGLIGRGYEYTVTATNDNGESPKCRPIDTDPTNWLNWDPKPGEGFRRRSDYEIAPFADAPAPTEYYPK